MIAQDVLKKAGISPAPQTGIFPVKVQALDAEGYPVNITEIDAAAESGHDPEHHVWIPLRKLHKLVVKN